MWTAAEWTYERLPEAFSRDARCSDVTRIGYRISNNPVSERDGKSFPNEVAPR